MAPLGGVPWLTLGQDEGPGDECRTPGRVNRRLDARIRTATFDWLSDQVARHADVLPRSLLTEGFLLDGSWIRLLGPQGIWKPAVMDVPLSIATVPSGPYDDGFDHDGVLHYRYRGTDPSHRDNVGLRFCMREDLPLVYFHRIVESKYVAAWPVFIVDDDPTNLTFQVQVDDAEHVGLGEGQGFVVAEGADSRRRYVTGKVRVRLHQRTFRERVLLAYQRSCAFCRFRHAELLDAAHITPDSDPLGEPVVSNGMALCRLHHGAFDRHFLAVDPDRLTIEVRPDLLDETDGPTLIHGIQKLHGRRIHLPRSSRDRPDRARLEVRYQGFLKEVGKGG
jgi:putative restriction endonuclease